MRLTNYTVKTPKEVRLEIVLLADIHGMALGEDFYSLLREQKPSVVLIAGDLVDEERPFSEHTVRLLKTCVGLAPTYFSFGNNDEVLTEKELNRMRDLGVRVLDNEWVSLKDGVFLGGLTSAMVLRCRRYGLHAKEKVETETDWLKDFERLNGYKILLDHHPENYRIYTRELDIDLILSGHTHGGQIAIFGYGLLTPGQKLWPRYSGGFYERRLIVSRGLSNTLPIPRIGNPPELVSVQITGEVEKP